MLPLNRQVLLNREDCAMISSRAKVLIEATS
jgi:hypothetical protein